MAVESASIESEDLWRRVGLSELRRALRHIDHLTRTFEQVLQELPRPAIRAPGAVCWSRFTSLVVTWVAS